MASIYRGKLTVTIIAAVMTMAAGAATTARAQDIGPALDPTLMTGWAGGAAVQQDLERRAREASHNGRNKSSHTGFTKSNAKFDYAPSSTLSQQAKDRYLKQIDAMDPQMAQGLREAFKVQSPETIYRGIIDGTGLHNNDAADTFTVYMVLGWMIANKKMAEPTTASMRAARAQMAAILKKNPKLASQANRALMSEDLKLRIVTIHGGWQAAVQAKKLPAYSDTVAGLFNQQSGINMRGLQLTSNGFAKR